MGTTVLVDNQVEDGNKLIQALDRSQFSLVGALWFYSSSDEWRLLLVSPLVDTIGPKQCYGVIQSVLKDLKLSFGLERISVLSPNDNLIRLLKTAVKTSNGTSRIRFSRNSINGVFIEDALIYRLC